jgi:hypothetical protein
MFWQNRANKNHHQSILAANSTGNYYQGSSRRYGLP